MPPSDDSNARSDGRRAFVPVPGVLDPDTLDDFDEIEATDEPAADSVTEPPTSAPSTRTRAMSGNRRANAPESRSQDPGTTIQAAPSRLTTMSSRIE